MHYFLTFILLFTLLGKPGKKAHQANKAYHNGDYKKAAQLYKEAIKKNPDNAKLYYNLGNALAKTGSSKEAIKYYKKYKKILAASQQQNKTNDNSRADYNMGNIYSHEKKWSEAVKSYQKALRQKADDPDAKHNYELALKHQKEQQKKKKNNKNQKKRQKQNQNKKRKKNQKSNNNNSQHNNRKKQKPHPNPHNMSKAEANRILQALKKEEKKVMKKVMKKKHKSTSSSHGKDW
jgi:tetratricopeptide (TPR) repeat protein